MYFKATLQNRFLWKLILAFLLLTVSKTFAQNGEGIKKEPKRELREPEAATGWKNKSATTGKLFMVVAANKYASDAAYTILESGGSAIDAAIAAQLVLTLVEPQSSGIGGGAFILHWDNKNHHLQTYDGREVAPNLAGSDLFLDEEGKAIEWIDAVIGGRSVGVPGVLAALKLAHDEHGKLPWNTLFESAVHLAERGFVVSPRLAKLLTMDFNPGIHRLPEINAYFFPNGEPVKAGHVLKNPKLANVYRSIALDGIDAFYDGWIAKKIVEKVNQAKIAPGLLSLEDLKTYKVIKREPVCGEYRNHAVCGMGPPSSGGIAVIQSLGHLSRFELSKFAPNDAQAIHLYTQSSRLSFADRNKYVADADFVQVPIEGLVTHSYLESRGELINPDKDMGTAFAGKPVGATAMASSETLERPSTSHISIVDAQGNAVSMTSSLENGFGSALMVEGFILNNQLTDFALTPIKNGHWVANRIEARKRPRSSMAPMMIFDEKQNLKYVLGSPGGSRIINYVTQTIIGMIDWKLDPQEAIDLPKVTNRNGETTLEKGTDAEKLKPLLEAKGHVVRIKDLNSGLHVIELKEGTLIGGADPRREGVVRTK